VENHYAKGSGEHFSPIQESFSPLPHPTRYKGGYLLQQRFGSPPVSSRNRKRFPNHEDENFESEGGKKYRQDMNPIMNLAQVAAEGEDKDEVVIADNMKIEEFVDQVCRKLEIPSEMAQITAQKLKDHGFQITAGLKNLKKESWEKIDLPLAIEEEMKSQIAGKVYNQFYGMIPFWGLNTTLSYGYPEDQETLGESEMSKDDEKEENGEVSIQEENT